MDRYKEVGLLLISDQRSFFERNEVVVATGHHNFGAEFGFDQLLQAHCYIEHQFLFGVSALANRARIMTAVTRINDYSGELKPKTSHQ